MNGYRDWIGDVRELGVQAVAQAFGHRLARINSLRSGMPCPACGQETRHRKSRDKRGAVGFTRDGMGWRCFQCDASGDAVTFASYLSGHRGRATREVRAACERVGLLGHFGQPRVAAPPIRRPEGSNYPARSELQALLSQCVPVDRDTYASIWLARRNLDPQRVADLGPDVLLALPKNASVPSWAQLKNKSWGEIEYRLVAPLVDVGGTVRRVHARVTTDLPPEGWPKSTNPTGYALAGLVLACPLAKLWLSGQPLGDASPSTHWIARVGLVIAEGLPDFLTWLVSHSDADQDAPAVIGIVSGSWTQRFADRIPDSATVTIDTHHDSQGDKYADHIIRTLCARMRQGAVRVRRTKPMLRGAAA